MGMSGILYSIVHCDRAFLLRIGIRLVIEKIEQE